MRPHSTSGSRRPEAPDCSGTPRFGVTPLRCSVLLLVLVGTPTLAAQQPGATPSRRPDVAVYSLTLSDSANSGLRALAESCVTRLVVQLAAESLTVTRRPPLDLVDLRRARPARFAIVGTLRLAAGKYSLEWDLVEVDSGDELRAYFAGPSAANILGSPVAAAPRIAAAIRERDAEANR
jgi:TolB-like protein